MPTAGPNSPGTQGEDNSAGGVSWSDAANIAASDDSYATCGLAASGSPSEDSYYLVATNFGFSVTGTVQTVEVEVEAKASAGSAVEDVEVKLVKGGTISGNNKATNTALGTSDAYASYSHTPAQWGVALSDSDVNASTFGVAVRFINVTPGGPTVSVDHVRITVTTTDDVTDSYYTAQVQQAAAYCAARREAPRPRQEGGAALPGADPAYDPALGAAWYTQAATDTTAAQAAHDRRDEVEPY